MKTLFKIMRSIITSLLFLLLIGVLVIQFVFFTFALTDKRFSDIIDRKNVLYELYKDEKIENKEIENIAINYVDDYINYVFYKRSHPSIITIDLSILSEKDKASAKEILEKLKSSTDIDYETIVKIRNVTNFITNRSIYLLINIGVFLIFLIISITQMSFKRSTKLLSVSISLTGVITLISKFSLVNKINNISVPMFRSILNNIFTDEFLKEILVRSTVYIIAGIIIYFLIFIFDKIINKRQTQTN